MFAYKYIYVPPMSLVPAEYKRGAKSPGTEVPDVVSSCLGAENWAQLLCNSKHLPTESFLQAQGPFNKNGRIQCEGLQAHFDGQWKI